MIKANNWRQEAEELKREWADESRWWGIARPYAPEEVLALQGSISIDHSLARMGASRLWSLLQSERLVRALGALTGNQAVQQVQAGLKAIYLSGWQVAADANTAMQMYPDQSLYPVDSAAAAIRRINHALLRADQIQHMNSFKTAAEQAAPPETAERHGHNGSRIDQLNDQSLFGGSASGAIDYLAPIVADAEAGFGGVLNTFELIKSMIEAGAAGVHLEDQLSSLKKCGHMGGKVLVPTHEFIQKLVSARLAADVLNVPTVIIGRTDANGANLMLGNTDAVDHEFMTGEKTEDGFAVVRGGLQYAIARAIAFAPYCDLIWCETQTPDLDEAREFARRVHEAHPRKLLAYNCSPSFNWQRHLDPDQIARFQDELAEMGYRFQFVTLAGFHTLNASMFELAHGYSKSGMAAYAKLQQREFELEREAGYTAIKHQSFVGAGYFDRVQTVVGGGKVSTSALEGSTEQHQFERA